MRQYGAADPEIRMGDVGLFAALVAALDLPPAWQRRLIKDFNRAGTLEADLATLKLARGAGAEHAGVLAALAGSDPAAARALVTDLLSIAGIKAVGGRTVAEIAERFLEQAELGAATRLPAETTRRARALSRHRRRSRRGLGGAAHAGQRRRRSTSRRRSTPSSSAAASSPPAAST